MQVMKNIVKMREDRGIGKRNKVGMNTLIHTKHVHG